MLPPSKRRAILANQGQQTYADLFSRLEAVLSNLAKSGVNYHSGSRFAVYHQALEDLRRIPIDDTRPLEDRLLHTTLLECDLFVRSVATLIREPEVEGWKAVVSRAISGPTLADHHRHSSPARDAQFELLAAAIAREAGFGVRFSEPDVEVILSDGTAVGIAAKRIKSATKLRRRVVEASKQVTRSLFPGVVAVDLAFFGTGILDVPDMMSGMDILREQVRSYTRRNLEQLFTRVGKKSTMGLIIFASKLARVGEGPKLAPLLSIYATNLCEEKDRRGSLLGSLIAGLETGLERWILRDSWSNLGPQTPQVVNGVV